MAHRTRYIISSMIESFALIFIFFSPESAKVTLFPLKKKNIYTGFFSPVVFRLLSAQLVRGKKERGKIKKIPDML